MLESLSILNKTGLRLPVLPILEIKNDILGKNYSLSVAFVNKKESKEVNNKTRNKNKPTNVLSFALRKNEGEIILCPAVAKTENKKFNKTFAEFLGFLVIHAMLHLKGMEHSSTMEKAEDKYDKKYFYRNRLGVKDDSSHRGRVHQRRKKS